MSSKSDVSKTTRKVANPAPTTTRSLRQVTKKLLKKRAPLPSAEQPKQQLPTNVAELRVAHLDVPPEPYDFDVEGIDTSSVGFTESYRRVSLLHTTPKRGTGVAIDLVTGVANDYLQKGKDALESVGNMKREAKATAHDCLQGLYETVLSLSDSRNRHKFNLEQERSRHARELVRVERAHNQEMKVIKQQLIAEINLARTDIMGTLKEAQAIRSWLRYETEEPFRAIRKFREKQEGLERLLKQSVKASAGTEAGSVIPEWGLIESSLENITRILAALGNQLNILRNETTETKNLVVELSNYSKSVVPTPAFPIVTKTEIALDKIMQRLIVIESKQRSTHTIPTQKDLTSQLERIKKRIEIVSSEIRALKDNMTYAASPHRPTLETELMLEEAEEKLATRYSAEGYRKHNP